MSDDIKVQPAPAGLRKLGRKPDEKLFEIITTAPAPVLREYMSIAELDKRIARVQASREQQNAQHDELLAKLQAIRAQMASSK